MLMKHFFLNFLIKENEIPIYVELRNLNYFEGSLVDYITNMIFQNRLTPNNKILERLLKDGKFIFILDGYDELHESNKNKRKEELSLFIDKYRHNYFILTSRPGVYIESLPRFHNFNVCPIEYDEITDFIKKQLSILSNQDHFLREIEKIIYDDKNSDYFEYMTNPLLLSMFLFTFKNHPEMPHTKNRFYHNIFDTLCVKHDNFSKYGELHERRTKLKNEDFEEILKYFSYYSYFEGYFNFDKFYMVFRLKRIRDVLKYKFDIEDLIYDLTVSISIIIQDGLEYKFPHRSLQEYFVAILMSERAENTKIKDYQSRYLNGSANYDYNLWLLSEELDFIYFRRFVITEYDNLIAKLEGKNIKEKVFNYVKLLEPTLLCSKEDPDNPDADISIDTNSNFIYSCNYHIRNRNLLIFDGFYHNNLLSELIYNDKYLSSICQYTISPFEEFDSYQPIFQDTKILENETYIYIKFTPEVSNKLFKYFIEIGLNLFVENLIDYLKEYRSKLHQSIENRITLKNDLFEL